MVSKLSILLYIWYFQILFKTAEIRQLLGCNFFSYSVLKNELRYLVPKNVYSHNLPYENDVSLLLTFFLEA